MSEPPGSGGGPPRQREVELKPGGRGVPVTPDNVTEYIHRLADFRLNRQMDRSAAAFLRGFFCLIRPRWVRMFNEAELQALISGSEEGVDVGDLQAHVVYAGEPGPGQGAGAWARAPRLRRRARAATLLAAVPAPGSMHVCARLRAWLVAAVHTRLQAPSAACMHRTCSFAPTSW